MGCPVGDQVCLCFSVLFWEISSLLLLFCHLTGSRHFALLGQYYACEMQVAVDDMDFSSVNEDSRNCSISCLSWESGHKTFIWGSQHRLVGYPTLAFQLIQHDYIRHFCYLSLLEVYGLIYCTGCSCFPTYCCEPEGTCCFTCGASNMGQ